MDLETYLIDYGYWPEDAEKVVLAFLRGGIKGVEKKSQEALLAEIREKQGLADEESSNDADSISVDD
jgi:hypothetical protein